MREHPAVAFAEPNWVVTHQATSTDTYFTNGNLWGMYGDASAPANVYGSQAAEAWAAGHTGSSSVYVGVIDEGIDYEHVDLAANIWTNPFDPADGVDNDGNGYADDVHGWDFFQDNSEVYDGVRPSDYDTDLHGTHVAGTIGALGNGRGVVGVNWNVTMISAKFLGPDGGTIADAIAAVDYFVDLKTRHGLNLVAINNSWGGGGYSQALHDAVIRAAKANILFTAAAGNGNLAGIGQNNDSKASYPSNYNTTQGTSTESAAGYDAVIAVAALTSTGALAKYSNYGLTMVDIGAPGSGVWSTSPNNTLTRLDGTSMATPHVTGGIALYASTHPGATPQQIRSAILTTGVTTSSLGNKTVTGRRLNVSTF
ncbi:MAG TPA: S8 family peptidase [Pyrinomonadaceae bacterium]